MAISRTHLVQATVKGAINGQDFRNVLNFTTNEAVNDATRRDLLLGLAAAIIACWIDTLLPILPGTFVLQSVAVKELHPMISDEYEEFVASPTGNGGGTGESSPSFVAQLLRLRTGVAGRSNRGRMFLPPPVEGEITADTLGSGATDALLAFAACLAGKFVGASPTENFNLCVLSKKAVGTPPNYSLAVDKDVTDIIPVADVAVMRRRRRGHGR